MPHRTDPIRVVATCGLVETVTLVVERQRDDHDHEMCCGRVPRSILSVALRERVLQQLPLPVPDVTQPSPRLGAGSSCARGPAHPGPATPGRRPRWRDSLAERDRHVLMLGPAPKLVSQLPVFPRHRMTRFTVVILTRQSRAAQKFLNTEQPTITTHGFPFVHAIRDR